MPTPIANTWFTQAYYQETPDALWRMNDAAGSVVAADQTLNAYDATVVGGVTFNQAGWSGDGDTAALFDATSGYANVGNVAALAYTARLSVVAAFKSSNSLRFLVIVSKALSGSNKGWGLALDSGKVRFFAYNSAGVAVFDVSSPAATYADGAWHQVIATYDPIVANTVKIFIDGSSVATATPSGTPDANTARVLLGAIDHGLTAASLFDGSLDELALYPYVLSSTQVTALNGARNRTTNHKALMQSRSAILRSGASRSGYYNSRSIVLINNTDYANFVWKGTLRATDIIDDQPDTALFTIYIQPGQSQNGGFDPGGFDPGGFFVGTGIGSVQPGQTLILADGAANNRYFGGTIIRARRRSTPTPAGLLTAVTMIDVEAMDWTYLLNRRVVTKQYAAGMSISAVAIDIIANYTSGFTSANVQAGGPTLTSPLSLRNQKVGTALTALAESASPNWRWYVDPFRDVHFFKTETSQRPKSIVPGVYTYDALDYLLDLAQIRTRILIEGGGGQTTAPVAVGSTSIPVNECGWYVATGGEILSPAGERITYTGRSVSSGAGNITGVPAAGPGSISVPWLQGADAHVFVQVDDTAAQTALALLEGGDGIHEQPLSNAHWNVADCQQAGLAELATYAATVVTGTLWSRDKLFRSGKTLSIALPARGINVDVTIQQVERSLLTVNTWQFKVTFGTQWRNLTSVLQRVGRAA
jgi:hypothetical protein